MGIFLIKVSTQTFDIKLSVNYENYMIANLRILLKQGRQFSEAAKYLQRAAELDTNSSLPYHSLVKLLLRDPLINQEKLEDFFNIQYPELIETLGPENELSFWSVL